VACNGMAGGGGGARGEIRATGLGCALVSTHGALRFGARTRHDAHLSELAAPSLMHCEFVKEELVQVWHAASCECEQKEADGAAAVSGALQRVGTRELPLLSGGSTWDGTAPHRRFTHEPIRLCPPGARTVQNCTVPPVAVLQFTRYDPSPPSAGIVLHRPLVVDTCDCVFDEHDELP
jgi:hypothetical protein